MQPVLPLPRTPPGPAAGTASYIKWFSKSIFASVAGEGQDVVKLARSQWVSFSTMSARVMREGYAVNTREILSITPTGLCTLTENMWVGAEQEDLSTVPFLHFHLHIHLRSHHPSGLPSSGEWGDSRESRQKPVFSSHTSPTSRV